MLRKLRGFFIRVTKGTNARIHKGASAPDSGLEYRTPSTSRHSEALGLNTGRQYRGRKNRDVLNRGDTG